MVSIREDLSKAVLASQTTLEIEGGVIGFRLSNNHQAIRYYPIGAIYAGMAVMMPHREN